MRISITSPGKMDADARSSPLMLEAGGLEAWCREHGANDIGFLKIGDAALSGQGDVLRKRFSWAHSVVVVARRLDQHIMRVPFRGISAAVINDGYHDIKNLLCRISGGLEDLNVRTVTVPECVPMEAGPSDALPWSVSLKHLAEAAGLGVIGTNRLALHPEFGANVLFGAVIIDRPISRYSRSLDRSPCLNCNLCEVSCPTGAISRDGFDFSSCTIHIQADDRNHCDFCIAVCPAGRDAIEFLADRMTFFNGVVRPLREGRETVYVIPKSDAEAYATENFPHKPRSRVGKGFRPASIGQFILFLPHLFQKGQAEGLAARYHFKFEGKEAGEITVDIRDRVIRVEPGLVGKADLTLTVDSETWLAVFARNRNVMWDVILGRIRIKGWPLLLRAFGKCFPL